MKGELENRKLGPGAILRTLEPVGVLTATRFKQRGCVELGIRRCLAGRWLAAAMLACGLVQSGAQSTGIDAALMAKANEGDAAAEVKVGESYAEGKGVAPDAKQAAAWYQKAADQGNVSGEMHLADLFRDGAGKAFPRDMTQAAGWYRKAADQGDASAQGTLGMLYTLGQGVPQSDVEAYFWLELAASVKGPNQAQYDANRRNVGTRITADELADIEDRVAKWKAAHPRPESSK